MKTIMAFALAATVATGFVASAPADARGGCGLGFHRGPYGGCRPNLRDRFYHGYGYWDGTRYWQHRDRWHGGWRYR